MRCFLGMSLLGPLAPIGIYFPRFVREQYTWQHAIYVLHVEFALAAHEEDFLDCAEQLEKAQGVGNLSENKRYTLGE